MNMTKKLLGTLALVVGVLFLTDVAVAQQDNLIDTIKKRGKLQVGFGSFLPWAIRDKQGNWVGFEIDVSTKLAKDMGVELELMPTAWDGIIPSLIAGKFDVIIGGLTVTPARQEQVDFTEPYSQSGQGIAASKQLASSLKYPEGYNDAKVTFVCRRGSGGMQDHRGEVAEGDDPAVRRRCHRFPGSDQRQRARDPHRASRSRRSSRCKIPTSCSSRRTITLRPPFEGFALRKGNPGRDRLLQRLDRQEQGLAEATPHVLVQDAATGPPTCRPADAGR